MECEHDIDELSDEEKFRAHWTEDKYGAEIRLDCGCECTKCQEY